MKKFLFLILFLFFSSELVSQTVDDTLGVAQISNSYLISQNSLQFDIYISRINNDWEYWANGTFQFELDTSDYDYASLDLEYLDQTTELNPAVYPGMPPYEIHTQIFDNRFSVFVLGPPRANQYTRQVELLEKVKVGTFVVSSPNGTPIPEKLRWKQPVKKWQANAFKVENVSDVPEYLSFNGMESNDNIEMTSREYNFISYENDADRDPVFALDYFEADYAGIKKVALNWRTETEIHNEGFTIYRAPRINPESAPEDLEYESLVATHKEGPKYSPIMEGSFYSKDPIDYVYEFDTVEYRGGQYCYKLTYTNNAGEKNTLAYDCLLIPNAVISEASASPNPFNERTRIDYKLEDDVFVTAKSYDVVGKFIKHLTDPESGKPIDGLQKPAGNYETYFSATELASQGLYTIVITATPISDPSVEISRAVIKTQYLHD